RLRRRQPGDRDAVGRGADVIEAGLLAEGDARRIAAVLSADAELDVGPGRPAPLGGEGDELADALDVEADEGIAGIDALVDVGGEEVARIVPRNAESSLRQVIGSEREEPGLLGDLTRHERGTGQLDHRA